MKSTFKISKLKDLPNQPGVYRFISKDGGILYIGKATSLRARVNSYFMRPLDDRLQKMVSLAHTVKITPTDSALEALILEANLIKKHLPKYNVKEKDDRSFVEIAISDEDFPQIRVIRPTQNINFKIKKTFGPYVSAMQARQALKIISKIFKFYCKGKPFSGRPCLYYQIGICPGVCVGKINKKQYNQTIKKVIAFLEGKKSRIIARAKVAMEKAAKEQDFETAARLRDELFALKHIKDTALRFNESSSLLEHSYPKRLEAYDISNLGSDWAVASMVVVKNGVADNSEYRKFKIKLKGQNDPAMVKEVLERRLARTDWETPDFILVDGGKTQVGAAQRALKNAKMDIPLAGVIKGADRKEARLQLTDSAQKWLQSNRLTTKLFEPIARLARDEAHRFAINYHRKLKRKSITE